MASEILGLFNTPSVQQLRNAALDSSMVSPAQMGQQGLLQQVVSMGQNAGAMLGMGAGQLLGGKVAGEVEASYINDAIQYAAQKGGTPSEKMSYVAEFLADKPGMGAQYMKALEEKRRIDLQELQTQKAKFDVENQFKVDVNTEILRDEKGAPIINPLTQQPLVKEIKTTYKYNPKTGQWEKFMGQEEKKAPKAETGTPALTEAEKMKAALERRLAEEAKAARRAIDPNMPQLNVSP